MSDQERNGANVDLKELVILMREEGVIRLKTTNTEIELHPSALYRKLEDGYIEEKIEEKEEKMEMSPAEKIAFAKSRMNQMLGNI